jgi:Domain of unknown function (DUF4386)
VEDSKWERWSALGGILFIVLIIVSAFMPGTPPKTSDSAAKIARFFNDNGDAIRWAAFVGAVGTIGLFWFLGGVWRVLRRAEGGDPRLTVVAVAGAIFAAVMGAVGSITLSAIGIAGVVGSGGASGTKFFYVLSTNLGLGTVIGIAVFLTAFSVVILRTGVFPKLLGWFGVLIAVVAVVSAAAVSSTRDVFFNLSFVAFIGFALWLLIISVMMLRGTGAASETSAA